MISRNSTFYVSKRCLSCPKSIFGRYFGSTSLWSFLLSHQSHFQQDCDRYFLKEFQDRLIRKNSRAKCKKKSILTKHRKNFEKSQIFEIFEIFENPKEWKFSKFSKILKFRLFWEFLKIFRFLVKMRFFRFFFILLSKIF